jgi:hypothetical protein
LVLSIARRGVTFLMDNVSYMMNLLNGVYESDRGWRHYRATGKTYDVQFNPRTLEWKCTCPHHIFKRVQCKHIKEIQNGKK